MATVFETVRSAAAELRAAGVDTPEHDAKLLCAEAFGTRLQDVDKAMLMGGEIEAFAATRAGSVLRGSRNAQATQSVEAALRAFRVMVDRRTNREPLQHITGHAPFRYLDLKVGPGVFIPRPETELIVQEGLDWAVKHGMYTARVVDLCAGSGAIGLAFATEMPGSEVWAVEKASVPRNGRGAISTRPRKSIPASQATIIWRSPMRRSIRRWANWMERSTSCSRIRHMYR